MTTMHRATQPHVETALTYATCGKPICPDGMVETPVGMGGLIGIVLLGPQLHAFGAGGGAVPPGALGPTLLGRPFFLRYAGLAAAAAFWRVR